MKTTNKNINYVTLKIDNRVLAKILADFNLCIYANHIYPVDKALKIMFGLEPQSSNYDSIQNAIQIVSNHV